MNLDLKNSAGCVGVAQRESQPAVADVLREAKSTIEAYCLGAAPQTLQRIDALLAALSEGHRVAVRPGGPPYPCNCRHPGSLGGDCDGSCQCPPPDAAEHAHISERIAVLQGDLDRESHEAESYHTFWIEERSRRIAAENALKRIKEFPYVGEQAAQQMALIAGKTLQDAVSSPVTEKTDG